jgi:hypothetical protein
LLGDEECAPSGAAGEAKAKQKGREERKGKDAHRINRIDRYIDIRETRETGRREA